MTQAQRDKLSIIQHYLYYNPTVLYAPNGTAADKIIEKANTTIAFVDLISNYATVWLNISRRMHAYLHEEKTARNLQLVKKENMEFRHSRENSSW
ncbi:ATP-binding cassette sub-family A member 2-like [Physella acuta]|uniref:ATP-binding cassette sub-family A member 2-like n=1 Tax=Physella acuta TaxID=109671 RepID=UPI0027DC80B7|nr:ATP-binding cassette sub-family A member 2-like [Physella acuta]